MKNRHVVPRRNQAGRVIDKPHQLATELPQNVTIDPRLIRCTPHNNAAALWLDVPPADQRQCAIGFVGRHLNHSDVVTRPCRRNRNWHMYLRRYLSSKLSVGNSSSLPSQYPRYRALSRRSKPSDATKSTNSLAFQNRTGIRLP